MTIERLPPGDIVEMRDPVMGGLKLGLVDDTGLGYFDIHGENELPKVIHSELQPRALGSVGSWLRDLDPEFAEALTRAWVEMVNKRLDVLTIARALRAGIDQQITVVELLEEAGKQATERVLAGREAVQSALPR
ncbi:hypothetical protein [Burkholderia arboris]|uniref:hypothetical protein n=1 Tax=Burkholderia arboris TaxID=488730 RepID=UPI001CF1E830|nr:hypothetical protein [Burkholderia arboris]MCA8050910.1 hypothetical protein [Burkholderia arboris]CAJ6611947.1 Uncharacterised protein [Burkholderia pseudomallei]CAJ6695544.1 Uncharacterised protein [Burkholderia pseudomallei]